MYTDRVALRIADTSVTKIAGTASSGLLATTRAGCLPFGSIVGNQLRSGIGSLQYFLRFSRNSLCRSATTGPAIRMLVSRQPLLPEGESATDDDPLECTPLMLI